MLDIKTVISNQYEGKCIICGCDVMSRQGFIVLEGEYWVREVCYCCSCLNEKVNKENKVIK